MRKGCMNNPEWVRIYEQKRKERADALYKRFTQEIENHMEKTRLESQRDMWKLLELRYE